MMATFLLSKEKGKPVICVCAFNAKGKKILHHILSIKVSSMYIEKTANKKIGSLNIKNAFSSQLIVDKPPLFYMKLWQYT